MSSGVVLVVQAVFDILIGLIVMVYLLNMKEKLLAQAKMIIYGVFPLKIANKVIEEGRYVHQVFGGFIIGKLLDSLIIGLICFVLLGFANMPYVLLVSVIVGVTNVIRFRTVHRGHSKRVPDPVIRSDEMPVFPDLRPSAAAV